MTDWRFLSALRGWTLVRDSSSGVMTPPACFIQRSDSRTSVCKVVILLQRYRSLFACAPLCYSYSLNVWNIFGFSSLLNTKEGMIIMFMWLNELNYRGWKHMCTGQFGIMFGNNFILMMGGTKKTRVFMPREQRSLCLSVCEEGISGECRSVYTWDSCKAVQNDSRERGVFHWSD